MNPATNELGRMLLRKQYMNNLKLEAKNNDINYQANKLFEITGEEPVRPPDTTSVEQKYNDVLSLQTLVRKQLMELTDGSNANIIVDNLSTQDLQFVANRMPSIIDELKPKFALGIPAQVFLDYVRKLKQKFQSTLDIEYGSSGETPFSSATSSPEVQFENIYMKPEVIGLEGVNPMTPKRNNLIEDYSPASTNYKTGNEKKDTSPFAAVENVKSLDDFKELNFQDKKAWLTAKARGQKFTLNGNPINKSDLRAKTLENTNVFDIVSSILGTKGNGFRMRGKGLKPRISVDKAAKGVEKEKRYIPFGRYVINKHQLKNKDIMMIKTMKGGSIGQLPTTKVSNPLSNVIQKMMGGHIPSFDDINCLSADDKHMLHHITKKSYIDLSVPAPNKDKLAQEMNRFEILKGEMLAGNDNKEMIKEFKIMLLKFMNDGRLPRRQGQEILTDLVAMGY